MTRRWWPEAVIAIALVALTAVGVWALWGAPEHRSSTTPPVEAAPTGVIPST